MHTLHRVLKCRMQVVDNLGKNVGGTLIAVLVDQEQLQAPFSDGEALDRSFFGAVGACC